MVKNGERENIGKQLSGGKRALYGGLLSTVLFVVWTLLIQTIDVQLLGEAGTEVGFATWNGRFHEWTGVHMLLYSITDWLGLVPIFVCMFFGGYGLKQLVVGKSLGKVDLDLLFLGIYYILVILGYLVFEMIPINYRPILIDGRIEASYPSSTTLLVLSVMPTLIFQAKRRWKRKGIQKIISVIAVGFSFFMVIGRLISGVHWFTDIVGSVLLSGGLFGIYKAFVLLRSKEEN